MTPNTLPAAGTKCARSNVNGATVIHLAAGVGHPLIIKELLKTLKVDVNKQTQDGSTPLHFAVRSRKVRGTNAENEICWTRWAIVILIWCAEVC